jgi:hypothetical protein
LVRFCAVLSCHAHCNVPRDTHSFTSTLHLLFFDRAEKAQSARGVSCPICSTPTDTKQEGCRVGCRCCEGTAKDQQGKDRCYTQS